MTRTRRAGWAGVVWLLAAGAVAQEAPGPRPGRDAEGGDPQRMIPVEQRQRLLLRDAATPGGGRRLSVEERRQLRRDIHEAGRDLYPERMPRGHREQRGQ